MVAAQVANGGTGAWGVLRYGRKGRLDDNFGRDGIRVLSFGPDYEFARSVAVQPNGRIVVAGRIRHNADDQWGIVRLKGNGSFDKGFAKAGGRPSASGVAATRPGRGPAGQRQDRDRWRGDHPREATDRRGPVDRVVTAIAGGPGPAGPRALHLQARVWHNRSRCLNRRSTTYRSSRGAPDARRVHARLGTSRGTGGPFGFQSVKG